MPFVAAPGLSPCAGLARSKADTRTTAAAVACVGVCALVLVAPFEALRPLLTFPGQSLTTVEATLAVALGAWVLALLTTRTLPDWRTTLTIPWLVVVAAMLTAALAAPAHRNNALNMVGRLGLAFGVYLLAVNAVLSAARLRTVLVATAVAGAAVAALAVLEYLGFAPALRFLALFRPSVAFVGSEVRASGPLQYPTIASMFLEVSFAFALALMIIAADSRRKAWSAAYGALAVVITQAIVLTFTRAGLITVGSTLAVVAWLRYRRAGFDRGVAVLGVVAAVFTVQLLSSRSTEYLRLRLTTETMESWFRAEIQAPGQLQMKTGGRAEVPVRIRNVGGATWDSSAPQPFRLSYHWLRADENTVVSWGGLRTLFPVQVLPGASIALDAHVEAPAEPGDYRLLWDVEQTDRLWFSSEPDASLYMTRVVVSGPAVAVTASPSAYRPPLPIGAVRPGRLVLWRAAAGLLAKRPLFGVGPDNYRLLYGDYAGLSNFDRRVHANNMYLEMLVGGGIIGGAVFAWLCWAAARQLAAAVRASRGMAIEPAVGAIAAATLAIGLHGLVDSFLSFTATYILIAVTLGLSSASLALTRTHTHRN
jgi:hypothetical protein